MSVRNFAALFRILRRRAQIDCGKLITDLMSKLAPETLSETIAGEDLTTKVKLQTGWTRISWQRDMSLKSMVLKPKVQVRSASGSKRQRHNCNQQHLPGQAAQKRKSVVGEREEGEEGMKEKGDGTMETGNQKARIKERRNEGEEVEREQEDEERVNEKEVREEGAKRQRRKKGVEREREREDGKEKGKCCEKVVKGNEGDEEKVGKDVKGEDEGMATTPQIHLDFGQNDVRDEVTDGTVKVDERRR